MLYAHWRISAHPGRGRPGGINAVILVKIIPFPVQLTMSEYYQVRRIGSHTRFVPNLLIVMITYRFLINSE